MRMKGSNPVPVAIRGTKMYQIVFLKLISLLTLFFLLNSDYELSNSLMLVSYTWLCIMSEQTGGYLDF